MNFLEKTLDSKANPLTALGKMGVIPGFVNKFNDEAELESRFFNVPLS